MELPITSAPKFYSIESASFPGYFLTQQGSRVVMTSKNEQNPFQLWYIDNAWSIGSKKQFAFINQGSKQVLKAQPSPADRPTKAFVGEYDPVIRDELSIWSFDSTPGASKIVNASSPKAFLGLNTDQCKDATPVIVGDVSTLWLVTEYKPSAIYKIFCLWYTQYLTWKPKLEDVNFAVSGVKNDELNVVAVHSNNKTKEGTDWYRIPAGGRADTTFNSSFILINQATGLALKGSTKIGDKTVLTEYDPLDCNFVWSENRAQNPGASRNIVINLDGTTLQWQVPPDTYYQNASYYHPLTLMPGADSYGYVDRQTFCFELSS